MQDGETNLEEPQQKHSSGKINEETPPNRMDNDSGGGGGGGVQKLGLEAGLGEKGEDGGRVESGHVPPANVVCGEAL